MLTEELLAKHYLPSLADKHQKQDVYYQLIIRLYKNRNQQFATFVDRLKETCPKLSERDIVMCILMYQENFNVEELRNLLGFMSVGSFSTAKSRLKSTLKNATQTPTVKSVLQCMNSYK